MEQVQVVHQLMEYVAPAALNKDSAVSVGVRVDGARGSLPAHIAGEGHAHPPPWGLCEERPWQRGHLRPVSPTGGLGRALHPRPRRPAPPRGGAHHQPHGRILGERRDGEAVRGEAGGLVRLGDLLVVVVVVAAVGGGDGEEGCAAAASAIGGEGGEREERAGGGGDRDGLHACPGGDGETPSTTRNLQPCVRL